MAEDTNNSNHHNKDKSILVLDDESDIVRIVERFLQGLGFTVCALLNQVGALFPSNSFEQPFDMISSPLITIFHQQIYSAKRIRHTCIPLQDVMESSI